MKFSEDLLKEFDLEPTESKDPVNVMQVKDMLHFLKLCADRIDRKSILYQDTKDADIQLDCIDIVTAKLNDFTQVFKDFIIFMRKEEGTQKNATSLRYAITSYDTFGFLQTEKEKEFLRELLIRNEITHDYFNRDIHQQKLVWIMENCSSGALDVYENISYYCTEKGLLTKYADRNA
ncbi:MAG: hypothetical protein ACRDBO_05080 [Lachnospiraceae bacterium]